MLSSNSIEISQGQLCLLAFSSLQGRSVGFVCGSVDISVCGLSYASDCKPTTGQISSTHGGE